MPGNRRPAVARALAAPPVKIESADPASQTVKIKANTREVGGQSNGTGDVTISLRGGSGTIDAVANVSGKEASLGEGTIVGVLLQLIKSFSANVAHASGTAAHSDHYEHR